MTLTHGSLFTGVGGFDLGFQRAGIETLWMVEYDVACQSVLRHRFPGVELHGDIAEVDPTNLAPVDIISFGSPCQGLSVAGQQRGLEDDERSNLFYEAIRIIQGVRPAIALWENVPGAFSSAQGDDFASVIDSLADIGALDIGWRVLDSRYFGVPQRRRRIYLVADFRAERTEQILALSEGVRRYTPTRRKARENTPSALTKGLGSGGPDFAHAAAGWLVPEYADTLRSMSDSPASHNKVNGTDRGTLIPEIAGTYWDGGQTSDTLDVSQLVKGQMMPEKRRMPVVIETTAYQCHGTNVGPMGTLREGDGGLTSGVPFVTESIAFDFKRNPVTDDVAPALRATPHDTTWANGGGMAAVAFGITDDETIGTEILPTMGTPSASGGGHPPAVAFTQNQREEVREIDSAMALQAEPGSHQSTYLIQNATRGKSQNGLGITDDDASYTLDQASQHAVATAMRVRRLTPMECERLQGFPDEWTLVPQPLKKGRGKKAIDKFTLMPDSQRYRQMGNAVTVNVTEYLGHRIVEALS